MPSFLYSLRKKIRREKQVGHMNPWRLSETVLMVMGVESHLIFAPWRNLSLVPPLLLCRGLDSLPFTARFPFARSLARSLTHRGRSLRCNVIFIPLRQACKKWVMARERKWKIDWFLPRTLLRTRPRRRSSSSRARVGLFFQQKIMHIHTWDKKGARAAALALDKSMRAPGRTNGSGAHQVGALSCAAAREFWSSAAAGNPLRDTQPLLTLCFVISGAGYLILLWICSSANF